MDSVRVEGRAVGSREGREGIHYPTSQKATLALGGGLTVCLHLSGSTMSLLTKHWMCFGLDPSLISRKANEFFSAVLPDLTQPPITMVSPMRLRAAGSRCERR